MYLLPRKCQAHRSCWKVIFEWMDFVCLVALKIVYQLSSKVFPRPWSRCHTLRVLLSSMPCAWPALHCLWLDASLPCPAAHSFVRGPLVFVSAVQLFSQSLSDATLFPWGLTCKPISHESVRYLLCVSKTYFFFFCKLTKFYCGWWGRTCHLNIHLPLCSCFS